MSEKQLQDLFKVLLGAGRATAWTLFAYAVTYLFALQVPSQVITPNETATLFAALVGSICLIFPKYLTATAQDLEDCLRDVQILFIEETITQGERDQLRANCIAKHRGH